MKTMDKQILDYVEPAASNSSETIGYFYGLIAALVAWVCKHIACRWLELEWRNKESQVIERVTKKVTEDVIKEMKELLNERSK